MQMEGRLLKKWSNSNSIPLLDVFYYILDIECKCLTKGTTKKTRRQTVAKKRLKFKETEYSK